MTSSNAKSMLLRKIIRTVVLGVVSLMAVATPVIAADEANINNQIDSLFATWNTGRTPGGAVIVTLNGKIIHRKGYGLAHLEYGIPITPETVFHSASVSKQFTAFAIAMLADRGSLDTRKSVHDYVPEVPQFKWPIILDQMIHHTSGLRDVVSLFLVQGRNISDVSTDAQIMQLIKMQQDLNFEPNSQFSYTNAGYTLLSQVVERVSNKSFRQWTNDNIFEPLSMTNSHFNDDYTELVSGRAYSYQPNSMEIQQSGKGTYGKFPMNFSMVGSTGLLTTVDDLAKWMDNLITGAYGGTELRDRMTTRGVLNDGTKIDYGYGLNLAPYRGVPTISHGGVDAGFRSSLMVLPQQKLGIAVLGNTTDFPAVTITQQIADMFLPKQKSEATAPIAQSAAATNNTAKNAASITIIPNQYSGRYIMEDGSFLHITEREMGINLQVGPTALKLYPTATDSFFITEADAGVSFNRLENKVYQQATLRNSESRTNGTRVSTDVANPEILAEYAGRYYLPEIEKFMDITVKEGGLSTWTAGVEGIGVSYVKKDTFMNPQVGATLNFERNKDGKLVSARASLLRIKNMLMEKTGP